METNMTDKLLKDFFRENKHDIADNGFTRRVMLSIPDHTDRGWIVWIFAAIGMAISLYLGITSGFIDQILTILKHVSFYYILGGIFCFPLVGTAGFYLTQNKNYRVI